jgi:hypothetical protein
VLHSIALLSARLAPRVLPEVTRLLP